MVLCNRHLQFPVCWELGECHNAFFIRALMKKKGSYVVLYTELHFPPILSLKAYPAEASIVQARWYDWDIACKSYRWFCANDY